MKFIVAAIAFASAFASPPAGPAQLPPSVVDKSVPSTAGTLSVKPGPLAKYTWSNFTADKAKLNTAYPPKDLHHVHPRYKLAAAGSTYIRNPYNPIDMNNINNNQSGLNLASTPSIVVDPNNPASSASLLEEDNTAIVNGKKWNCGGNCSVEARKAARYPARRDHPEDFMAPQMVDVPKIEQRNQIPEMYNDISCCGTYFDGYDGANRVDSLHPDGGQPLGKLGVLSYSGGGNYSRIGNHKAPCRPCSGEVTKHKFDQWENPESTVGGSMKPEYKSFIEMDTAAIPFNKPEPSGDFGSDHHDLLVGVAHRDFPGDNPMDFTKMRNINGHAFQAADKKVLPVMHHVPELVEKLGQDCVGCVGAANMVQPETKRCAECSKKNEPASYFSPEWEAVSAFVEEGELASHVQA